FGWSCNLPAITRRTDKGLPRYRDLEESDVFVLAGAEDLVPVLDDAGERASTRRRVNRIDYEIRAYRPRTEGMFARIERWIEIASGVSHWRTISRENLTSLYGFDPPSRIVDPSDPRKVFSYLICRSFDDKGNIMVFDYVGDDGTGVDLLAPHERNRTAAVRQTQRYLKRVRYGNAQPYFADWSAETGPSALPADWYFQVVFDYGDHPVAAPTPIPAQPWPVRPDPFSSYRAAFEVRTYRRCARVLLFHNFPAEI